VGDTIGGSHVSALELIRGLPRNSVETVVVLHRRGALADYLGELGVPFDLAPEVGVVSAGSLLAQGAGMLRCAPALAGYVRNRGIDIVHTHDLRMHRTWSLAAKLAGARVIWHQRSADSSRRLALYSRSADRVLTVSQFCKAKLPGSMGRRAIVVPNPFGPAASSADRAAARVRVLQELGVTADARIVGFVGNLTEQKRPVLFIEMAAKLGERGSIDFVFPMFGETREPMLSTARVLIADHGLGGKCVLMGARRPIEPWIAGCDILVAPGVNEGLGRTVIEANLCGTPVIAAADGGHLEIVSHGKTGLLVTPDDPSAFAEAVMLLAENPDYAADLAEAACRSAAARFSLKSHIETMLQLYAEVTASGTSTRPRTIAP
jgi:glycosyltransferase involved in cell wall biosynthesis